MTTEEANARRACYQAGVADTLAALMASASAAIEHCEATAATFAQEPSGVSKMCQQLMLDAAQRIRNIVTDVQAAAQATKGNEPHA